MTLPATGLSATGLRVSRAQRHHKLARPVDGGCQDPPRLNLELRPTPTYPAPDDLLHWMKYTSSIQMSVVRAGPEPGRVFFWPCQFMP